MPLFCRTMDRLLRRQEAPRGYSTAGARPDAFIAFLENYDQIVLLMEGEVLASGTHEHLMQTSPEYVQIYDSQRSTSHYELHA